MAALFAAVTILYSSLWMYVVRHPRAPVELGMDSEFSERNQWLAVQGVQKESPAEQAGLRAGDRILAVNGRRLESVKLFDDVWFRGRPGDSVELSIERPGQPGTLTLRGIFRTARRRSSEVGLARESALELTGSFPVLFLVVGLTVLFLRLDDSNAWLLSLLFGGFIALPGPTSFAALSPALQAFAMTYRAVFLGLFGALFYLFFAVFPTRSPLDRRIPWLKWVALMLGASIALPGLHVGDVRAPAVLIRIVGQSVASIAVHLYIYLFFALGLVSLVGNSRRASTPEARRKIRVILWGTIIGVLPAAAERGAIDFAGFRPSFWFDVTVILIVFLFPLSFAYAVVKHRVLEIPALLKRSARYVLVQRGYIVVLFVVAAAAIALFTHTISRFFPADANIGMALSAVFGVVLVWASAPMVKRGTERIDRAFFRSAYDARVILQDLAEKTRTVTDRRELAMLLENHIKGALHPKSLACYLEAGDGNLVAECGPAPREFDTIPAALPRPKFPLRFGALFIPQELDTIPAALPLLREIAQRGKAWDVPQSPDAAGDLGPLAPECLVPIPGRDSRLIGLLVLGRRLSEEPYSGEDKRLLDSVASQAAIALENIRLAEKIAERMEAEHRAAREMEIAREVQARLFPQKMPPLRTLEYAGGCIQARQVGGDYYDFLDFGAGRLGVVLADISGKGISGALLMANLQANLRSQYAIALEDLPRLLESVNRLFVENSPDNSYATLFFGVYDDATRCLRYANCGHNPPLLFRDTGEIDRLTATTTVVGAFSDWECITAETSLRPGDLLVLYTDGITEAPNAAGEEFGEQQLIHTVRSQRHASPGALLTSIQAAAEQFTGGTQADDLTLVVARVR